MLPPGKYGPSAFPFIRLGIFLIASTTLSVANRDVGNFSIIGNMIGARAWGIAQSSTTNPSRGFSWSRKSRTDVIHGPTGRVGEGSGCAIALASKPVLYLE